MSDRIPDDIVNGVTVRVWDKPSCIDRYTILYMSRPRVRGSGGFFVREGVFSGSEPRGMSGHLECSAGPHLGKRIPFNQLPESVQQFVRNDTKEK